MVLAIMQAIKCWQCFAKLDQSRLGDSINKTPLQDEESRKGEERGTEKNEVVGYNL
jgi:hypothetical protein